MISRGLGDAFVRSELDQALARLDTIDGVMGSLIATRDGSIVASAIGGGALAQSLAATTAAICGRLAEVVDRLGLGSVNAVLTDTTTHSLQFMPVGGAVLAVIAKRNFNVRAIREGMRGVALDLAGHPALLAAGAGPPPKIS